MRSIGPSMSAAPAILSRKATNAADIAEPAYLYRGAHPRHAPPAARLRTTSPQPRVSYHPEETINGSESESGSDEAAS